MVQNILPIWLDNNIDDNSTTTCRDTIAQLRSVVNTIHYFTDRDQCIDFLMDINNENVCLIISGTLCRTIVPFIHDVAQLQIIFIFCTNKTQLEQWAKEWPKVKGVYTNILSICTALKETANDCEHNAMSISVIASSDDVFKKKLDQLDVSFMYTQILKEILLTIKFENKHRTQFIDYCREQFQGNDRELKNIQRLESEYDDRTPIWWYTCESFLYPMLNRALRSMDVALIIKLGFFAGDLHRQIEQLHNQQFPDDHSKKKLILYRGQGMAQTDYEKIKTSTGGLLSFNCFLSTSTDHNVSLRFASRAARNPDMVGVLFVMTIDPSQSTTPFASITEVGYYGKKEDEVLFSMHTVFRIGAVRPVDENDHLFRVELTSTSDSDKDLRRLADHIREETFQNRVGWYQLASALLQMGQSEKAQEVYEILLEQETDERTKASIYNQLGNTKSDLGEYKEALAFYEKGLEIQKNRLPPNHPHLAVSYNNIGAVHRNMGDYAKAHSSFEQALAIQQLSLPPNHPLLTSFLNNIGMLRHSMGDYPKALLSYEKALAMRQQSLPPNHPHLASSYTHIGLVQESMGDYPKALSSFEKAFAIQQQSLPPNHRHLAGSYHNIGMQRHKVGDYPKALLSYEKALAIQQQSLPPNHPDLASSYNNIGGVHEKLGDYPRALSSFEKALDIRQQSLPPNHPDLAGSYNNIGAVHGDMGDYPRALSSFEKALAIQQQSLPPNHPLLASSYNNMGLLYEKMGNYWKAYSSYDRAVQIAQCSLPPHHPKLEQYRMQRDAIKRKT